MANFFDWFKNQPADGNNSNNSNSEAPVTIFVTPGNEVEIPAAEAANQTISQLFATYADVLGIEADDSQRIIDNGRQCGRNEAPVPGRVYRLVANSFVKGAH